jgi:hypothetical protein
VHHHRVRHAAALLAGVILIVVVVALGRIPGTPPPPVDLPGDPQCKVSVVATQGVPPGDDADRLARRIKRFCEANGGLTPPAAVGDTPAGSVNARQSCLAMAGQVQGLTTEDCMKIPPDSTYYWHH